MFMTNFFLSLALAMTLSVDPFQYEYSGQTDGKGRASITVVANQNMSNMTVVIQGDGKTIKKNFSLRQGGRKTITWKQSARVADYDLEISGDNLQGEFHFQVAKATGKAGQVGNLKVVSDRDEIVKGKKVRYRAPSPLSSYEYKVYDTAGDVISSDLVKQEIGQGEIFEVSWDTPGEVFMIHTKAENDFGGFTEYKLVPWSVKIPHTEVNFDSGKYDIKDDEEWKVEEAMAVAFHELVALDKVNKAVNANITPKLYIVGYTDTVGKPGKNQVLSENRAQSIAKYFHDHGFWAEIYYAGMGERGLRVQTGDNVDEVKNRRALYLLTVQEPAAGGQIPGRWKKLAGARSMPAGFTPPPLPKKFENYKEEAAAENGGGESADGGGGGSSSDGDPLPSESGVDDYSSDDGSDGAPPPVEGEPGATQKGCSIASEPTPPGSLALLVMAAAWRRRRS